MTAPRPLVGGIRMPCDQCKTRAATVEADAFMFCAECARTTSYPSPVRTAAMTAPAIVPNSTALQPHIQAVPQVLPARLGIGQLLEDASGHSVKKIARLGARIETDLDVLRGLVAEHAATEKQRQAEAAAVAKAKADVERLKAELQKAQALLPKSSGTGKRAGTREGDLLVSPNPCTSCGGKVTKPAGTRGIYPARCDTCRAAA